jgi:hypothetical protein
MASRARGQKHLSGESHTESPLAKAFKASKTSAATAPDEPSDMLSRLLANPTISKHFGAGVPDGSVISQGSGEHEDSQQKLRQAPLQQGSEPLAVLPAEPQAIATKKELVEAPAEGHSGNLIDDILHSMIHEPSVLGAGSDMDKMLAQSLKPEMLTSPVAKNEQTEEIDTNAKAKALKEVRWPSPQMCAR